MLYNIVHCTECVLASLICYFKVVKMHSVQWVILREMWFTAYYIHMQSIKLCMAIFLVVGC